MQLIAARREKSLLLGVTGYINQPQGQDLCFGVVGQHKIDPTFFVCFFVLVWFGKLCGYGVGEDLEKVGEGEILSKYIV